MIKLTKKTFKQIILDKGSIPLDKNGELNYVVTQINTENFKDINDCFKKQLEDEGKYNLWIGFVACEQQTPYSINSLPIFGSAEKYITKWFTNTAEETIDKDLNDRGMGLLKRANIYRENNL